MGLNKKTKSSPFILIGKRQLDAPEWVAVGYAGRDFYIELKRNYNGYNNGELICSYEFMRKKYRYGYGTVRKAIKLLCECGLIELTGRGELAGLGGVKANKYRLTGKYERVIPGKK